MRKNSSSSLIASTIIPIGLYDSSHPRKQCPLRTALCPLDRRLGSRAGPMKSCCADRCGPSRIIIQHRFFPFFFTQACADKKGRPLPTTMSGGEAQRPALHDATVATRNVHPEDGTQALQQGQGAEAHKRLLDCSLRSTNVAERGELLQSPSRVTEHFLGT